MVVTQLFDMCMTTGQQSGTADSVFNKMDEILRSCEIPWDKCVGAGIDNTSVNLSRGNSIRIRVLQQNPATYFMSCPCHIMHNIHCSTESVRELYICFKV